MRTPTRETPFKLAYGSEAVIPAEMHMASHRVKGYQVEENEVQLRLNLDLIDKVRTVAKQRTTRYKNLMARQYDAMVKPRLSRPKFVEHEFRYMTSLLNLYNLLNTINPKKIKTPK